MDSNAIKVSFQRQDLFLFVDAEKIIVESQGVDVFTLTPHSSVERLVCQGEPANWTSVKDIDEGDFAFASCEKDGVQVFTWTGRSNNWDRKEYRLECDGKGYQYFVTVTGRGNVGMIGYFDGATDDRDKVGSPFEFAGYFVPNCNTSSTERMYYPSTMSYESFFELLVPPMYVYAFNTGDIEAWQGLGMIAKAGEYNFIQYDFHTGNTRFWLSTNMEGHKVVEGTWEAPSIRGFSADTEYEVVEQYSSFHYDSGLCKHWHVAEEPRWWYGPIMCGFVEQSYQRAANATEGMMLHASQRTYERIADMLEERNLKPTILIIDDKWQEKYGIARPELRRWPDLRGFSDRMHKKGIHTLLWFRLWGGEGLPTDETMPGDGVKGWNKNQFELYADPSNPKYVARLKETIRFLLSSEEGCMDCDGFKLDFAFWMGYGRRAKSYTGEYGVELMKKLFTIIYETAKEVKPDALINASPCHPYFDEVFDQTRLHDYGGECRNASTIMALRKRLYGIACPGHSVDTDNPGLGNRRDSLKYIQYQPALGIPDIYQLSDSKGFDMNENDWDVIRRVWEDYSRKMDEKFAK